MKILVIADTESKFLWDHFDKDYVKDIDLILAAGDLKASYLSFLTTLCNVPVYYVPGNHDKAYLVEPPDGCVNCDDKIRRFGDLRIAGLGGCMKYSKQHFQYTQREMTLRAFRLSLRAFFHGGIDILLTHAPAYGIGDGDDLAHIGFEAFLKLMDRFSPLLMVHGHVHMNYGYKIKREEQYKNTRIINAFDKYIVELDDELILKRHPKDKRNS